MTNDTANVEATINRYFRGMNEGDVSLLKSSFHEQAGFFGPFGPELIAAPIAHLYDWAGENLPVENGGGDHRMEIDEVEIKGPIALVKCHERGFMGHDFAEYFTLLKTDDGWKITNKSYAAI